jgi:NTE family protein
VGVYQALEEAGIMPDWVSGVSIGAINSALIAGNPPERRLERLRTFWDRITDRKVTYYTPDGDFYRQMRNALSSFYTMMLGQPGFFIPQKQSPWMSAPGSKTATSYYDTEPLRQTLLELVDFDLINDPAHIRFSVGAVNVLTGNFVYFDNANERIEPEHIMASGALPPAFPMVKVGTDYFWDGGLVSNTPLQHLLEEDDKLNSLVFQVDLFSARGALPRAMPDVASRQKDITYSSRTRYTTDVYRRLLDWKKKTHAALSKIPDEALDDEDRKLKADLSKLPEIAILQLIYQQKTYEGDAKDYEFSRTSMKDHWLSGYEDTKKTVQRRGCLQMPPPGTGVSVFDIHHDADRL